MFPDPESTVGNYSDLALCAGTICVVCHTNMNIRYPFGAQQSWHQSPADVFIFVWLSEEKSKAISIVMDMEVDSSSPGRKRSLDEADEPADDDFPVYQRMSFFGEHRRSVLVGSCYVLLSPNT